METGRIKFYQPERGFGFIVAEDGEDVFLPSFAVRQAGSPRLAKGARVSFERVRGSRGAWQVHQMRLLPGAPEPPPEAAPQDRAHTIEAASKVSWTRWTGETAEAFRERVLADAGRLGLGEVRFDLGASVLAQAPKPDPAPSWLPAFLRQP